MQHYKIPHCALITIAPNVPGITNFIELFNNFVSTMTLEHSEEKQILGSRIPVAGTGTGIGTTHIWKLSSFQISVFLVRMATWWSGDNSGYELRERDSGVNGGLAGGQTLDHPTPDLDTHSVIKHPHPKLPKWPDISPHHYSTIITSTRVVCSAEHQPEFSKTSPPTPPPTDFC